jgi:hypothetical protein
MAFITPKMSLKVWNSEADPYDHEQLADNFLKLDQHDHSFGKGTQIPASGLAPGAVTGDKIAPGSIGGPQVLNSSITSDHIVDGTITLVDLAPEVLPAGLIIPFALPVTAGVSEPTGWLLANGQEVLKTTYSRLWDAFGNTHLYGTPIDSTKFKLPDLAQRFPLGRGGSRVIGDSGGAFTHRHTIPNHTHTGTASGLSGAASVSVSGNTTNESGGHVHFGPGTGFIYVNAAGTSRIPLAADTPSGVNVSAGSYSSDTKDILGDPAHHVHNFTQTASGSATGVGGGISVGSGTDIGSSTLQTATDTGEVGTPPYLVLNFLIKN